MGYQGEIATVRDRVRKLRPPRDAKAFLTLEVGPGDVMQVDWCDFALPGVPRRVSMSEKVTSGLNEYQGRLQWLCGDARVLMVQLSRVHPHSRDGDVAAMHESSSAVPQRSNHRRRRVQVQQRFRSLRAVFICMDHGSV